MRRDFVTIRVTKSNLGAPVEVEKGLHVRVHGFLQSRDYQESLADFLKDARGADLAIPENLDPSGLRAPRGTTEVIARRIMRQRNGTEKSEMCKQCHLDQRRMWSSILQVMPQGVIRRTIEYLSWAVRLPIRRPERFPQEGCVSAFFVP